MERDQKKSLDIYPQLHVKQNDEPLTTTSMAMRMGMGVRAPTSGDILGKLVATTAETAHENSDTGKAAAQNARAE